MQNDFQADYRELYLRIAFLYERMREEYPARKLDRTWMEILNGLLKILLEASRVMPPISCWQELGRLSTKLKREYKGEKGEKPDYESLYKNLYNRVLELQQKMDKYGVEDGKILWFCGKITLDFIIIDELERLSGELNTRPVFFWNTRPGKYWLVRMQKKLPK